eukprot:931926-Amphidinium_carterae.1
MTAVSRLGGLGPQLQLLSLGSCFLVVAVCGSTPAFGVKGIAASPGVNGIAAGVAGGRST